MDAILDSIFSGRMGGHLIVGALAVARLFPVVFLVPFFGGKLVPATAKMGLILGLAVILSPTLSAEAAEAAMGLTTADLVMLALKEGLIGVAIGFLAALMFYAIEMAGSLIDTARGQTMATALVPSMPERVSQTSAFGLQLVIVVYLSLDGHHLLIRALAESFQVIPLTEFPAVGLGIDATFSLGARLTGEMFVIALAISLPVLAAAFLVDMGLGVLNRAAPQIQVFFLGMPIKALLGVLVVLLALAAIVEVMTSSLQETNSWIRWLIHLMEP